MAIKKFSVVFYCQFLNYCISIWKWNKKKRNVMFSEVSEWWILEEPQYKNGWNNWLQTLNTFLTDCFTTEYPYFLLQNFHQFWRRIFQENNQKTDCSRKYLKRRKSRASLCLSLGSRHIGEKKSLKTTILYFFSIKILNTFYKVTVTNKKQILILLVQELMK